MFNKIFSKVVAITIICALCLCGTVCNAASFERFADFDETVTDELQYTDELLFKGNGGEWDADAIDNNAVAKASGNSPRIEFPQGSSFSDSFAFAFSVCFTDEASTLNVRANYNGAGSGWHADLKDLIIFSNGTISGKFVSETSSSYETDTWYDVILVFDFDSASYDVYINGTKISDTPGSIGSRSTIKYFRIEVNGEDGAGNGDVLVDNLFVCEKPINFTSTVDNGAEIEITEGNITIDFGTFVKYTDETDISITCNGEVAEGVTLIPEMVGDYFKSLIIDVDGYYEEDSQYEVTISPSVKSIWGESAENVFSFTTLEYVPSISLSLLTDITDVCGGEIVKLGIDALNVTESDQIAIYNNGNLITKLESTSTEYDFVASAGENNVTAKVLSETDDELAVSNAVEFTTADMLQGTVIYSVDFEADDGSIWLPVDTTSGGGKSVVSDPSGGNHGNVLKLTGNSQIQNGPSFLPNLNSDVVVYEEWRYYEGEMNNEYLTVMIGIDSSGNSQWINPWRVSNTEIRYYHTDTDSYKLADFSCEEWHHIKVVYDSKNNVAHLYLDGVLIDKNRAINDVEYFQRVKYETRGRIVYYDQMKVYAMGYIPSASIEVYNSDDSASPEAVDYNTANFNVSFSERIDSSTLTPDTVKLISEYDEEVECTIAFTDAYNMTVTPKYSLAPDCRYTLSVKSGDTVKVKSGAGIELPDEYSLEVKTAKLPFSIASVSIGGGVDLEDIAPNTEFNVNISINDSLSTNAKAGIFVGIYKDNACYGLNYIDVDAAISTSYTAEMKSPVDIALGGYDLRIFMVDNLQTLKLLDFE